ncbi:hypothetical protein [Sapientia aquatica]|uniref:Uncharacterized protein n=1 Tax=Sapientia aquatica TaxID=1549640 RepID=A0A4R5W2Z4_9BURK|nr:hypothetical protein [Sapientia aquatica]TDK67089.1 hypothetical protein E2I14_04790 [Sapientia aquatica]
MFDLKQLEPNANNSAYYLIVFALLMLFASIWVGLNDPSNAIALYICLTGCLLGFSLVLWQLYQQKKSRVATQAGASSAAPDAPLVIHGGPMSETTANSTANSTANVTANSEFKEPVPMKSKPLGIEPKDTLPLVEQESPNAKTMAIVEPPVDLVALKKVVGQTQRPSEPLTTPTDVALAEINMPSSLAGESKMRSLMQSSLGDILVTGLLNNPDNVARIISKAIEDAKVAG